MRLVEHQEKKCPKCGSSVSKLQKFGQTDMPDYKCNKCGALLDIVW